jgi:hypothetical protein
VISMRRQENLEIGFGNPQQSVEPMRDENLLLDPAPNGPLAHSDALSDLFDREELRWSS